MAEEKAMPGEHHDTIMCTSCGKQLNSSARYCGNCGQSLQTNAGGQTTASSPKTFDFQSASDEITNRLGLERIEAFSLSQFFSQVFKKHDTNNIENLFSAGTMATTPELRSDMANMPNPWVFFRVLSGAVITYLIFYYSWNHFHNLNLLPGLIIVGSFAVPSAVLILFYELNTPRNISMTRVIQMVAAGGAISLLLSLLIFEATPLLGIFGASSAGIVEECGKLLAVLLVLRFVPVTRYPYKLNGLLIGAAVGTGFAAFESAGYALRIGLMDSNAMLANITLRGVMSPFGHIAWTAIATCAYLSVRKDCSDFGATIRNPKFFTLFGIPVALHFVWNLPFDGPLLAKFWILGFIAWVIIISLVQTGLREIKCIADSTFAVGMQKR